MSDEIIDNGNITNDDTTDTVEYKLYSERRDELTKHADETSLMLTKVLLAVNTGSFVISFTFVFQMANRGSIDSGHLIIKGLYLMVVAIISGISALWFDAILCNKYYKANELEYQILDNESLSKLGKGLGRTKTCIVIINKLVDIASTIQIITTIVGVLLLLRFAVINMDNVMHDNTKEAPCECSQKTAEKKS